MSSSDLATRNKGPEILVIGAGQAGLVMGYQLRRRGLQFQIVDAASEVGSVWRQRWDSLRLFTPAQYDSLPGMDFPATADTYPGKDDVADFLQAYAARFELPVKLNTKVIELTKSNGQFLAETDDGTLAANRVIVATGPFQAPRVPRIAERLDPEVLQFHSTAYRTPKAVTGDPVLVVGGGNTGFQIAADLAESHEVHLSIGSRQTPLPQRLLGRDLFWYLQGTGLIRKSTATRIGRRLAGRDTLIGSTPRALRRRHGVVLHGRTIDAAGSTVSFEDGPKLDVGTVIWATGFESDYGWIDLPVFDENGKVVHERGVTKSPGLYFLGLSWQHTRGSALLGWVKDDAEYIAEHISASRASTHDEKQAPQPVAQSTGETT